MNMPGTKFGYCISSFFKVLLYDGSKYLVFWHAQYIKIEDVGSPIIIMFTNVIIPGVVWVGLLVLGPYDFLVEILHKKLTSK